MATAPAQVDPQLLSWARKSIGYTIDAAAQRLSQEPARIERWEAGEDQPSVAQLRALAEVYKRPLAVFFLSEPPTDFQALQDFRRLPDAEAGEFTPALHAAILNANDLRESAVELARLLDDDLPEWPSSRATEDAEQLGRELRELLGVPLDEQQSWREPETALRAWTRAAEEAGALISQVQRIPVEEMRGFSISADVMPIVVLNGGDAPRGKIFTLFHELAHLALRASGVCDLHASRHARGGADRIEIFCNQAAAAALIPEEHIRAQLGNENPPDGRWAEAELRSLAQSYSVSQEVVLRRLLTLRRTTWEYYAEKREEYAEAYALAREREREERGLGDAPPIYYPLKIRDLGQRYVTMALDAYRSAAISTVEAADYLDVKAANIPGLERELARRTGG